MARGFPNRRPAPSSSPPRRIASTAPAGVTGTGTARSPTTIRRALAGAGDALRRSREAQALLWIGPSLLLTLAIIAYPVVTIVITSFQRINVSGLVAGTAGWDNYTHLLHQPDLKRVLWNTVVWVVVSVIIITAISLVLAALLNERFPGRRLVRIALLIPWAASVTITTIGFRWIFNYYYGMLNPFLETFRIIHAPVDWLGNDATFMPALVGVTVFVSVPFTTYVLLAGLQSVPTELREAAAIDGGRFRHYFRYVVLPWLRPYLVIESVLNAIWIFNSFAIVWVLNSANPGYIHDTAVTYVYKIAFVTEYDIGMAAAMSIVNIVILLALVLLYMRTVEVKDEDLR